MGSTLSQVKPNQQAQAAHIQRINNLINGVPGAGIPVKFIALRSAVDPALRVRNILPGGVHFQVDPSSADVSATPVLSVTDSGVFIHGDTVPSASSATTLSNKRVTFLDYVLGSQPTPPSTGFLRVFARAADNSMAAIDPQSNTYILSNPTDIITAFSGVNVDRSTDQPISNNTWTPVDWNRVLYDRGLPTYWLVATPRRLTSHYSGTDPYKVRAVVFFAANATGLRGIRIVSVNGTTAVRTVIQTNVVAAISGLATAVSVERTFNIANNDYIEIEVFQTSGGALNALTGTVDNPATNVEMTLQSGVTTTGSGGSSSSGSLAKSLLLAGV